MLFCKYLKIKPLVTSTHCEIKNKLLKSLSCKNKKLILIDIFITKKRPLEHFATPMRRRFFKEMSEVILLGRSGKWSFLVMKMSVRR